MARKKIKSLWTDEEIERAKIEGYQIAHAWSKQIDEMADKELAKIHKKIEQERPSIIGPMDGPTILVKRIVPTELYNKARRQRRFDHAEKRKRKG